MKFEPGDLLFNVKNRKFYKVLSNGEASIEKAVRLRSCYIIREVSPVNRLGQHLLKNKDIVKKWFRKATKTEKVLYGSK